MKDPFEGIDEIPPVERSDFDPAGHGHKSYRWAGIDYPRVTSILDFGKGGDRLSRWHAETAAKRAASFLVHAGLYTPREGDDLEEFVDSEAIRVLGFDDAIAQACHWQSNMREGDRYRDHKARVGSLCHHASYEFALGIRVEDDDLIPYLKSKAVELGHLESPGLVERYESLGKGTEDVLNDLAFHAARYWQSKRRWIEAFKPDWNMVGRRIAAIHTDEEYAGTPDEDYFLEQRHYEKAGFTWPFSKSKVRILSDDKNTNSRSIKGHAVQVSAYARASFFGCYDDKSTIPMPDYDGIAVIYNSDEIDSPLRAPWLFIGEETIDSLFEGFCGLNAWYRMVHNMPRAQRARKFTDKKPKRGDRPCPF